jgi:D-alanine-D-alanine ligase
MHVDDSKTRVAVFFGGNSAEHEVSINSGLVALGSLAAAFPVMPVFIDRQGRWHVPPEGFDHPNPVECAKHLSTRSENGVSAGQGLARLEEHETSVVFVALHGPYGEDGRMQGFLEIAELPYTGSGVLGSAIAMNKDVAKALYARAGLRVAPSRTISAEAFRSQPAILDRLIAELRLPLVVKPVAQGSSVGTSVCRQRSLLSSALEAALQHGGSALVEQFVQGRELTCGVLELDSSGRRCALPPTLIRPRSSEFFDYKAKYEPGASEELTPAPVEAAVAIAVQEAALQAHSLLQLRGYSRTDFMERSGEVFVLETNTLPGLTQTSLLPQSARVAGIELPVLLRHLVCLAVGLESPINPETLAGCLMAGLRSEDPASEVGL